MRTPKLAPEVVTYHYRGQVERGPSYEWREGYSPNTSTGGILYPWVTKTEAEAEAKRNGQRAVFQRTT